MFAKHEILKHGKHYFIAYDEKDEALVIKNIARYYRNFVILRTDYIHLFDSKDSFCFYYHDIDLDLLFTDSLVISSIYSEQNKVVLKNDRSTSYIYFYIIPEAQNDITVSLVQFEKIMIESISRYCVFDSEVVINNMLFLKFADIAGTNKKIKFLFVMGGIGDFFITFSIIKDYLKSNKYKDIYIVNYAKLKNPNFDYMVRLCYDSKVKLLDYYHYRYLLYYWLEQSENCLLNQKLATTFNLSEDKGEHMALSYKNILIGEKNVDYYQYSDILKRKIVRNVSSEEENYINTLIKNGSKNVGLQYFTGNFNSITNKWNFYGDRVWDDNNVNKFIKKCRQNNINLIVLNSETYAPSLQKFCTKKLSIEGYALLISKMDLVVSMDSSAGHIASFYDIPSITLWGNASPLELSYSGTAYIGYRTLRKNYSIIAKNRELASIHYHTVFSFVKKFAENKLDFKDDIITYQDSLNRYNMVYV